MLKVFCTATLGAALVAASCSSDAPSSSGSADAGQANAEAGRGDDTRPDAGGTKSTGGSTGEGTAGKQSTGGSVGGGAAGKQSTGGVNDPNAGASQGGVAGLAEPFEGGAPAGGAPGTAESGASGAGGESSCGKIIVNAGCADAHPETEDFQSGQFQGCVHFKSRTEGWITYDAYDGFAYDVKSGLGWVQRVSAGTMTRAELATYCASFEFAGSTAWRLPTIDEARVFAGGCAPTAPGGTCAVSDPSCLTQDCGTGVSCDSCVAHQGPYGVSKDYCPADAPFCISIATSSDCPDCATAGDWRNSPINGNFYTGSADSKVFAVCVSDDIARAIPCAAP